MVKQNRLMNILVVGTENRYTELQEKWSTLANNITLSHVEGLSLKSEDFSHIDVIIDTNLDEHPERLKHYANLENTLVLASSVKQQLAQMAFNHSEPLTCTLAGFNALPTFINRSLWEVSVLHETDKERIASTLTQLNIQHQWVADRVGMVAPRVIFMIINEACYTLQEGTASIADIDLAMKLGTNYPHGPFAWADKIGIHHIYQTLQAVYQDTKDERYRICPLLKTKYLKQETFYTS